MFNCNMDVVPGARAPVLAAPLLDRTHELNQDYVELLLAERSRPLPGKSVEALPGRLLDALAGLDVSARAALAHCPYALYSLGFDDQRFWSTVLSEAPSDKLTNTCERSIEARYGASGVVPTCVAFAEVALFAAWHTAQSNRFAAGFLFGMPDRIAAKLARAPVWQVRRIAIDCPDLLTPRWPTNPAFWPDLVRFAAAGDKARLETARLLGGQLIAAELDGAQPRHARSRLRLHRYAGA